KTCQLWMKTRSLRQIRCRTLRGNSLFNNAEAVDLRRAAIGANQSRQHFDCCTFTGAVGTDHQRDLLCIRAQRNASQDRFASEALRQILSRNHLFFARVVRVPRLRDCARIFQNWEVSGAGSSIELMPGMTARSFAKRNSFTAGLSERNAIAGKSRRNIPKRS